MTFSNVMICPQPKDIQFTVIEGSKNNVTMSWKKVLGNHSCKIVCKRIIICKCVQNSLGL